MASYEETVGNGGQTAFRNPERSFCSPVLQSYDVPGRRGLDVGVVY